jgi:hypothetical protein
VPTTSLRLNRSHVANRPRGSTSKSFLTLLHRWSGAVMCQAYLCGAEPRHPRIYETEIANEDIYQHWIIKVRVCYYKTDHCIDMDVPAWEKKESVPAIFPALKRFQFDVKEQF